VPAIITMYGFAATIFAMEALRQIGQFFITELSAGCHAGMSAGVQADIVRLSSFQPCVVAARTNAGSQDRA
jgi:hypothetical protein